MAWQDKDNLGFTNHNRSWLPPAPEHRCLAVEVQQKDPHSILTFIKTFIEFRKKYPALISGNIEWLTDSGDCLIYKRYDKHNELVIAINLSEQPFTVTKSLGSDLVWGQLNKNQIPANGVVIFKNK
jgi:alpha-glucosidase